jgi:uncharacterized membrane protein YqjE
MFCFLVCVFCVFVNIVLFIVFPHVYICLLSICAHFYRLSAGGNSTAVTYIVTVHIIMYKERRYKRNSETRHTLKHR